MYKVWHVDKYKITFKLVINSRRISRGPVPGRGPAVEKHCPRVIEWSALQDSGYLHTTRVNIPKLHILPNRTYYCVSYGPQNKQ